MNVTLRKLGLPFAFAAFVATAPSLAADNTGTAVAVPAATVALPAGQPVPHFSAKGPVRLDVNFYSEKDRKMDQLRIVKRSTVVGTNAANVAAGVALAVLGAPTAINGHAKEDFYGDEITDAQDKRKLASPFLVELPALLDQKIIDLADDEEGDAPSYKNVLSIRPVAWSLVYNELTADKEHEDEYVLRFAAAFSKVLEGEEDGFLRKARKVERECQYVSKPQSLAAWQQNDYDAVAAEQKRATQACIDQLAPYLSAFLGIDSNTRIRAAKLNCKNTFKQCVAGADGAAEPSEGKKICKEEYKQCVSTDVKPLISMTPVGQCKDTFASCKAAVFEKARAINPDQKPPKSEFVPCSTEYKACVAATR